MVQPVEPGVPVGYQASEDVPPARPASLAELRFKPKPPVRWYSPLLLADAALQVAMSSAFGAYLDKRELQAVLGKGGFTHVSWGQPEAEAWVDYVADTGDGFDPTYTVASLVGREELDVDNVPHALPRADVLVFGGDQVYPDATAGCYEDRFAGPFTAALPWLPPGQRPAMFATPGNHDWYDGLTSFMRVFGQQKSVGGWQTYQRRSYYAVKLPHKWWLLGIDVYVDAYIDEPQLRFFQDLPIAEGDQIILCTAEPKWVDTPADASAYRNLGYFERKIIAPKRAQVALTLAGDLHHYARYQEAGGETQKITAGGGGAFLHPTHDLPEWTSVRTDPEDAATETSYRRARTYPGHWWSRLLGLRTLLLPLRNRLFMLIPGVLYLLLTAEAVRTLGTNSTPADMFAEIYTNATAVGIAVLVFLALMGFAKPPRRTRPGRTTWIAKFGMGLVHTAMHVVAVPFVAWLTLYAVSRLQALTASAWTLTASVYVLGLVLGAIVGSVVFALYLIGANQANAEGNHAFSAHQHSGYKNFLRLHVRSDGALDVHAIGIDRACSDWQAPDDPVEDDAWLVPAGNGPHPHLIERLTLPGARPSEPDPTPDG